MVWASWVALNSVARLCPTFCSPMDCSTPGFPVHHQLPELMSTESMMPSNHLTFCFIIPFSSCLQSFPASGSFLMNQFLTSGGQSIGVSAPVSVSPMNNQDWFPLGLTGWISLQSKGLWRVFSNTTAQKHQFFGTQLSLWSNSHIYTWPLETSRWWWWWRVCLPMHKTEGMQEKRVQSLGQEDSPGGEHGNIFQYSCLENPMDKGAWATVHRVAKSQTWLTDLSLSRIKLVTVNIHRQGHTFYIN